MPTDPFDYMPYMDFEETSDQGGTKPPFSFSIPENNPPQDHSTWHRFPKLDMHKFDGFDPIGWISLME